MNNSSSNRAPVSDEELAQWAAVRADDAGHLARELIAHRQAQKNLSSDPSPVTEMVVKALEWTGDKDGDERNIYAKTPLGRYEVYQFVLHTDPPRTYYGWCRSPGRTDQKTESFEAAKLAAEESYRSDVLSCLVASEGRNDG